MASVLLFSSIRRHCFKLHSAIIGDLNSAPVYCWQGHIWFPLVFVFQSPVCFTPGLFGLFLYSLYQSFFPLSNSVSLFLCVSFSLWFIGNESGMREYAEGEMGTFREMAVSGQTSHQDGKVYVRVCVFVCVSSSSPTGDQRRAAFWLCPLSCNSPLHESGQPTVFK